MRDLIFLPLLAVLCLVALRRPWVGVLAWTWLSVMNPHAYTWSAKTMPVAAMVAGATLIGTLVAREGRQFFVTRESALLVIFMLWVTITYPFAFSPEGSYDMWSKVMKIDLMILVTLALLQSKRQLELFIWVVVLSLGFYGVKGGIFTIATGGAYMVLGPGGFIGGNNEVALALVIVIPLMRYLQLEAKQAWMKSAWTVAMVLTAIAALGSFSRGAFLAISAMGIFLWIKSKRKFAVAVAMVFVGVIVLSFMPERWESRMGTIATYEQDGSAMGRINAWWMTWNLAKDNLMGGGFDIYNRSLFARYAPNPLAVHAAHSIYFQVLGEHGFIGLFIFLLMWWFTWRSAAWLIRTGGSSEDTNWCRNLGAMCQASLVGYAVGGAFLSLAYFDLPYNILVMVVLAKRWLQKHGLSNSPVAAPGNVDLANRNPAVGHTS